MIKIRKYNNVIKMDNKNNKCYDDDNDNYKDNNNNKIMIVIIIRTILLIYRPVECSTPSNNGSKWKELKRSET